MFQRFLDAADNWFGYSDNSSTGSYDPTRECSVVLANDPANAMNAAEAGDGEVPPARELDCTRMRDRVHLPPRRRGVPTSTRSWTKRVRSKPNSWRNTARCDYFTPPSPRKPPRAASTRELGKQARECINTDFDIDSSSTPSRASQKLITAATLLQAMPAPSTPEAQNLHHEAQALIEQAAVQQAESLASRIRQ
jgi:hypothetical protein